MRAFDKSNIRASQFVRELAAQPKHPAYSSSHPFYKEVYFALLFSQEGCCAYTEQLLVAKDKLEEIHWQTGVYKGTLEPTGIAADIEHFDPDLKPTQGWLWDNLFLVDTYTNRDIKKQKAIHPFFKPDRADYSPEKYLAYDFSLHIFTVDPALALSDSAKELQIKEMLDILGINAITVVNRRGAYLNQLKNDYELGHKPLSTLDKEVYQFFTAYKMGKDEWA